MRAVSRHTQPPCWPLDFEVNASCERSSVVASLVAGDWPIRWQMSQDLLGVSENSVPLNPLVNDHYPYEKWLFHWEY